MLSNEYRDRVYAGWLGKCIGVRLGVPVENWSAEQIARELSSCGLPLVANMIEKGQTPLLTPTELRDLGFRLIASPLSLLFAATRGMRDVLDVLQREGTTRNELQLLLPFDEFGKVVDLDGHYTTEARYR